MKQLWVRRLLLVVLSFTIGYALTYGLVHSDYGIFDTQLTLNTDFSDFGTLNTVLTTAALTVASGVWLDKFLNTQLIGR